MRGRNHGLYCIHDDLLWQNALSPETLLDNLGNELGSPFPSFDEIGHAGGVGLKSAANTILILDQFPS